jgi:hypothetical protein
VVEILNLIQLSACAADYYILRMSNIFCNQVPGHQVGFMTAFSAALSSYPKEVFRNGFSAAPPASRNVGSAYLILQLA